MSNAACKAVICEVKSQSMLEEAVQKIYAIQEASIELRIEHSEIYIKHMKRAAKEADTVVMDSGE